VIPHASYVHSALYQHGSADSLHCIWRPASHRLRTVHCAVFRVLLLHRYTKFGVLFSAVYLHCVQIICTLPRRQDKTSLRSMHHSTLTKDTPTYPNWSNRFTCTEQFVNTTLQVKCTIGSTITHAADTHVEKTNNDLCLPAVQCRRVHCTSTRYRLCRAVYSAIAALILLCALALYTGTHSSQFIFFTFVSGACIY
jgi:hypothetical protein